MTDQELNIAIAEICGWKGIPVQQQWFIDSHGKTKYWRSVCPIEILDTLRNDYGFGSMQVARWLQKPDGTPLILHKQPAGFINNYQTFRDKPVIQWFSTTEEYKKAKNTWQFQVDPWPELSPSLEPFVKYLPDYCNDLNEMYKAEELLNPSQKAEYHTKLVRLTRNSEYGWVFHATAYQRAEAFLKTLKSYEKH